MVEDFKFYMIHNNDINRKMRILGELEKLEITENQIKWINYPNKEELDDELIKNITNKEGLNKGLISCTYKHYLCLCDMIEHGHKQSIIMEDNWYVSSPTPIETFQKIIQDLNEFYFDWDIVFDSTMYDHPYPIPGLNVHPLTNGENGSRLAQFYFISLEGAKKIVKELIPFHKPPDHQMNDIIRKLNIQSLWTQPAITSVYPHISTTS